MQWNGWWFHPRPHCQASPRLGGAMTEKALLPRDVQTYGMNRTNESDVLIESEMEMKNYCRNKDVKIAEFKVFCI